MAHRYWLACYNTGFVGSTQEEEIDFLDYVEDEAALEALSDDEVEEEIAAMAYEMATENINAYAKKLDK